MIENTPRHNLALRSFLIPNIRYQVTSKDVTWGCVCVCQVVCCVTIYVMFMMTDYYEEGKRELKRRPYNTCKHHYMPPYFGTKPLTCNTTLWNIIIACFWQAIVDNEFCNIWNCPMQSIIAFKLIQKETFFEKK